MSLMIMVSSSCSNRSSSILVKELTTRCIPLIMDSLVFRSPSLILLNNPICVPPYACVVVSRSGCSSFKSLETPSACIVTPYSTLASSMALRR